MSHKEIKAKSAEIIKRAQTRKKPLSASIHSSSTIWPKSLLSVFPMDYKLLRSAKGDCNEHTALFVSLARAARIPTRIAAGLVYSDEQVQERAFIIMHGQKYCYKTHGFPSILHLDNSPQMPRIKSGRRRSGQADFHHGTSWETFHSNSSMHSEDS